MLLQTAVCPQQMTLNRYSYNCMAHLASLNGRLEDATLIYNMMKADRRPDSKPDSYTYSALVRAAVAAGRGDVLPAIFNEMVAARRAEERARGRGRGVAAAGEEGDAEEGAQSGMGLSLEVGRTGGWGRGWVRAGRGQWWCCGLSQAMRHAVNAGGASGQDRVGT